MHSDTGASAKVRQDHEDGLRARDQVSDACGFCCNGVQSSQTRSSITCPSTHSNSRLIFR